MKRKLSITLLLSVLILWVGTAMAIDPAKIGNLQTSIHMAPFNQYQSDPMDSVLVIKGKINMGTTNYYSVQPLFEDHLFTIDGKPLETLFQEVGIYKADIAPQFKSSASAGWTIYLCAKTGSNPSRWEKFQAMNNFTLTSTGIARIKYQQNDNTQAIVVTPMEGTKITKPIGAVKPK